MIYQTQFVKNMIISHKNKFIFIKPAKVAGSSVEVALSKWHGENDIITPQEKFNLKSDEDFYNSPGRNYKGFHGHISAEEVRKKIGENIWNSYFKFTIVRNPWDIVVSKYFYEKYRTFKKEFSYNNLKEKIKIKDIISGKILKKAKNFIKLNLERKNNVNNFNDFVIFFVKNLKNNSEFYFDSQGLPILDFYMRYENLEDDYKKICEIIKIPYEELPKLKTKQRKNKRNYSEYYNQKTKEMIANKFEKEIDYFKYRF